MKKKNYSAYLCVVWAFATILNCVSCVNQFVSDNSLLAIIFLCVSVGFGFGTGILFNKAVEIQKHNQQVDWLKGIAREIEQELVNSINPFDDMKGD